MKKKIVIDDENATVKVTGYDLNDPKDNRKLVLLREILTEEKMHYTMYVNGVIA